MYHNVRNKQGRFTSSKSINPVPGITYTWTDGNSVTVVPLPAFDGDTLPEIPVRRLFFDIEVSPNVVHTWNIGRKINVSYHDIQEERAVICICWKWEGNDKVGSLKWKDGDDREMLAQFAKVLNSADEIVTHNGDSFDVKWLRTRCLLYGIQVNPKFKSVDTLKVCKKYFRFNCNRLDYVARFLGIGSKVSTESGLWTKVMQGDNKALTSMVDYCKGDVTLLEEVYNRLKPYMYEKNKSNIQKAR